MRGDLGFPLDPSRTPSLWGWTFEGGQQASTGSHLSVPRKDCKPGGLSAYAQTTPTLEEDRKGRIGDILAMGLANTAVAEGSVLAGVVAEPGLEGLPPLQGENQKETAILQRQLQQLSQEQTQQQQSKAAELPGDCTVLYWFQQRPAGFAGQWRTPTERAPPLLPGSWWVCTGQNLAY